jgi:glycosyltransferase involved in cell wall biosynthesis
MTDKVPSVSVLLVTYNHAKFVRQALDGVLMQQTAFDFEIVAVDDCSTDGTLGILQDYEKQHPKLRVLPAPENLGISRNYQRGFAACRGEFVAVLEGDDYWISPRKLEITREFLKRNPSCSFCFHRIFRHDQHPETVMIFPPHWTVEQILTVNELATENFSAGMSTCVYRRAIIAGLSPQLWELDVREWFFNMVVAQHGPIGYVPQVLSVYRTHPGGIWALKSRAEKESELQRLLDSYDKFLEFKYQKEFDSFRKKLSPVFVSPTVPVPLYWRVRIWILSRLPVRLKKQLKRLITGND